MLCLLYSHPNSQTIFIVSTHTCTYLTLSSSYENIACALFGIAQTIVGVITPTHHLSSVPDTTTIVLVKVILMLC